jgi:ABC-type branched-subunit amino acid transport system ATPase component
MACFRGSRRGLAVLVVEQNARAALRFARLGAVVEDGAITLAGEAEALRQDPRVVAAYIGAHGSQNWAGAPDPQTQPAQI